MKNGRIIRPYLLSLKEMIEKRLFQKSKKAAKKQLRFFRLKLKAEFVNDYTENKRKK
jgi:tRNA A37 N6-isopentenylltransferase MiaA